MIPCDVPDGYLYDLCQPGGNLRDQPALRIHRVARAPIGLQLLGKPFGEDDPSSSACLRANQLTGKVQSALGLKERPPESNLEKAGRSNDEKNMRPRQGRR